MVGTGTWFAGRERCTAFLATVLGSPGDWRMEPILANGQPAVVAWLRGERFGGAVLTVAKGGITRITVWGDPRFAVPPPGSWPVPERRRRSGS
jgi:RNA polymerase sigma-70 factor (ECF subfamily)